jgi:hypothetical protein
MFKLSAALMMGVMLSACGGAGDGGLMNIRNTETGPDEFAVLPNAPLQIPSDLSALPEPTLGGENRVDPNPQADAIAALGGNINRGVRGGSGLLNYANRFGGADDIRATLAAEDREFRADNPGRVLERAFGTNVYFRAYRFMTLDADAEYQRLRAQGVRTLARSPNPTEDDDD